MDGHTPTRGDYDRSTVDGMDELLEQIKQAESVEDWSRILTEHLSWGNNKVSKLTALFNLTSATDCPNAKTKEDGESETGLCQVEWDVCYAHVDEVTYPAPLHYRRRQTEIWDHLDADTFTRAFLDHVDNKVTHHSSPVDERSDVDVRLNESGDFRHGGDIIKAERIAELLAEHGITVYCYTASYKLDWSIAETLVVNESVSFAEYGDRDFQVVPDEDAVPDDGDWVLCPFELEKQAGVPNEERTKCGECRLCLNKKGPNVAVIQH